MLLPPVPPAFPSAVFLHNTLFIIGWMAERLFPLSNLIFFNSITWCDYLCTASCSVVPCDVSTINNKQCLLNIPQTCWLIFYKKPLTYICNSLKSIFDRLLGTTLLDTRDIHKNTLTDNGQWTLWYLHSFQRIYDEWVGVSSYEELYTLLLVNKHFIPFDPQINKLASLEYTLVRNYDPPTQWPTDEDIC